MKWLISSLLKAFNTETEAKNNCFSLRIAVVGGNLTAENIKTVAEVAEKYGHGYVHMTSRQGVEIPFIKLEDIMLVKEETCKGRCRTGVCGPRVRTVTACQGSEIKDTSEESFLTSSSLVSQAVRTTA